jgi:fucose permease
MMYPTALQSLTPAHLRGRAVSVQFITTMIGAAAAPPTVGLVSDQVMGHREGPLLAVVSVAVPAILLGALLLRWCERHRFDATASDAARIDGTR